MNRKEWSLLVAIWILIAILYSLSSCSPAYHLRRSEKHLQKVIAKGAIVTHDTVFVEKILTVPEVRTDTVFESLEGDTVYISKERLKIKYVNLPGDSVFIEGECSTDTVTITVPVTIEKTITAPKGWKDYLPWILLILSVGVTAYLIRTIRSK